LLALARICSDLCLGRALLRGAVSEKVLGAASRRARGRRRRAGTCLALAACMSILLVRASRVSSNPGANAASALPAEVQLGSATDIRLTSISECLVLLSVPLKRCKSSRSSATLTPAEREVVDRARSGMSNCDIARERGCTPRTVANLLSQAYRKLHLSGRRELRAGAHVD
jgi:DNA-binding CsgD family transcriptional regulator